MICKKDNKAVLLPYPSPWKMISTSVLPYTVDDIFETGGEQRIRSVKNSKNASRKVAFLIGKKFNCNHYISYEKKISEIIDEDMRQNLRDHRYYCGKAKIQVAIRYPAV